MPRGGKREGAGRPKGEPTVVVRVPESLLPAVERLKQEHTSGGKKHRHVDTTLPPTPSKPG